MVVFNKNLIYTAKISNIKIGKNVNYNYMIKRFIIYGILGWGIEVFWTGLGSLMSGDMRLISFTNLWMFFIYGSAVFLEPINDIIAEWKWPIRGCIWVVIIWGMEYTSGLLISLIIHTKPWIYDGRFAVDHLINLEYAPAWFIAGLLFERAHKTLDKYKIV